MDASALPLIVGLSLHALGSVEGRRIRRPVDPVARWLLERRPDLSPAGGVAAAYATVRARTDVLDGLLLDEVDRARMRGESLSVHVVGGGFDARWFRLLSQVDDVVRAHVEVEHPGLLALKDRLLDRSPFAQAWSRVIRRPVPLREWGIAPREGLRPLVVMEGLAGRLGPDALRRVVEGVRLRGEGTRLLLGLPGFSAEPGTWSSARLRELGWRVDTDVRLASRGRLLSADGGEYCPGMHGVRVLRLVAGP